MKLHDKIREIEADALRHAEAHGTYAAALYRIAQGVEDPQGAARMALEGRGWVLPWPPPPEPGTTANTNTPEVGDEARRCPKCGNLWVNHTVTTLGTMAPCPPTHAHREEP